jgi:hypothetical protein
MGEKQAVRKPVFGTLTGSGLIVVCDEGSVFVNPINHTNWVKRDPIPGTEADR